MTQEQFIQQVNSSTDKFQIKQSEEHPDHLIVIGENYNEVMTYSLEELITLLRSDMYYASVDYHYSQMQRDEAILYHQLKRGEY